MTMKKQVSAEFLKIIKTKMDTDNLGVRELARLLGVSHPTITEIVTYENMPSFDTCNALSDWLGIPKTTGLRLAGLLPSNPSIDEETEELNQMIETLPADKKPIARLILKALLEGPPQAAPATSKRSTAKGKA